MKLFTRKTPAFLSWTLFKGKISLIHRKIWTVRHNFLPLAIASCLGVSLLVSCSKTVAPPLRVGTNLWPGYETLHLAKNLGYYKDTSIELVDLPSGTEQVRAFRNGNIDAAGISLDQALTLATTNPNVRIISIMDFSEGGDVILAKPDIPNLKALKGKRVGVEANALGAYIITRALEKAGMTTQDIQVVSLGLSEHERAFKDGKIDAVVTFGPARIKS
jgi:NitT/TauT family transport system substrate-binding protein